MFNLTCEVLVIIIYLTFQLTHYPPVQAFRQMYDLVDQDFVKCSFLKVKVHSLNTEPSGLAVAIHNKSDCDEACFILEVAGFKIFHEVLIYLCLFSPIEKAFAEHITLKDDLFVTQFEIRGINSGVKGDVANLRRVVNRFSGVFLTGKKYGEENENQRWFFHAFLM